MVVSGHARGVIALLWIATGCSRVMPQLETPAPSTSGVEVAQADPPDTPSTPPGTSRPAAPDAAEAPPPDSPDALLAAPWTEREEFAEQQDWFEELWTGRGSDTFRNYLRRKGAYEDLVMEGLETRGMPESLQYMPIIESGYNPTAVSWAGAVGLWQLMPGTARDAGLEVTAVLDERRDPVRSTDVALDFLEQLHDRFDSWLMALSAYNGGPARVARLARRHAPDMAYGDSVYFIIRPHLPRETREFIPKLLAAGALAGDPGRHGLGGVQPLDPLQWDEVTVPDATSLDVLAKAAEVAQEQVELLNPQLIRGFTPAGRETRVRVPPGTVTTFETNYARIPPGERVTFLEHRVVRGDTFWDIARGYGVPLAVLEGANPGISPARLQIGQWIVVPRAPRSGDERQGAQTEGTVANRGSSAQGTYVVRTGDTLSHIAQRYGVRVSDLRSWNGLSMSHVLHPGDRLQLHR